LEQENSSIEYAAARVFCPQCERLPVPVKLNCSPELVGILRTHRLQKEELIAHFLSAAEHGRLLEVKR
jgi:hypothetical protein